MSSSYIGRSVDAINNISTLDNLSFNGSDATFNLTQNSVAFVPVSSSALQIQIDGVIQANNFTISGSTLTFDFVPSSGSVCNSVKHFGVGLLTQPSDGSVNIAQLGASGTKDATTFLRGDNTFAVVSGTTINTNADNRVITGSGTANTLNGESKLTFDGSTLINTQDSGATSEIRASAATVYTKVIADDASGFSAIDFSHDLRFKYASTERVRIKQYDFCVGTTSPISTNGITFKAGTTAGDDWISSYRTTASTPHYIHAFYSDAGGTQTAKYAVYADGTASAISDVNYKKNITNARNYLEDLEKIDVIKYNLKTDNEDEFKKLGFSAQQVETIFPNMIDVDNTPLKEFYEEGDEIPEDKAIGDIKKTTAREVKLLKKEVFVPMLVKAVQELSAKVKTLETENTDIKARLTALENA